MKNDLKKLGFALLCGIFLGAYMELVCIAGHTDIIAQICLVPLATLVSMLGCEIGSYFNFAYHNFRRIACSVLYGALLTLFVVVEAMSCVAVQSYVIYGYSLLAFGYSAMSFWIGSWVFSNRV